MNYQLHYNKLIENAQRRNLSEGYERHHIIPKCMGGNNKKDNIAKLTPEEHYVAHQLLVKIYPDNRYLVLAAKMMTVSGGNVVRNNKMFGWLRKKFSEAMKDIGKPPSQKGKKQSAEHIKKRSESCDGYTHSKETRESISASNMGRISPRKDVSLSKETKDKLSVSVSNVPKLKCEFCNVLISPGNYKRWHGINCKENNNDH